MTKTSTVWLRSELAPDLSHYVVTLEASDDVARILTPTTGLKYAAGVLAAAERADYDAAVIRQMGVGLKLPLDVAGQVVSDMRQDRPPLRDVDTHPLRFEPGVNMEGDGFLVVSLNDERLGQWTVEDARLHAMGVLQVIAVADLDATYFRTLVGLVGLDKGRASQVVGDLGKYR